ncbi:hypothetical protein PGQ11_002883 [Apiospora arundinis]|uniref:Uncharacterized protein n=1 Tax=Apiospora arundinis TaxID=335852 RepID=A0ABR2J401_9PEZI
MMAVACGDGESQSNLTAAGFADYVAGLQRRQNADFAFLEPRGLGPAVLYWVAHPTQVQLQRALDHARSRTPAGAGQAGCAHLVRVQPVRPSNAAGQCAGHGQGPPGLAGFDPRESGPWQSLLAG